jgi:hypothetical protein
VHIWDRWKRARGVGSPLTNDFGHLSYLAVSVKISIRDNKQIFSTARLRMTPEGAILNKETVNRRDKL